jgi:hypothetical protein
MSKQDKPKRKKLAVRLKTVRQLDDRELDRATGGGKDPTNVSVPNCRPFTTNHNQRLRAR